MEDIRGLKEQINLLSQKITALQLSGNRNTVYPQKTENVFLSEPNSNIKVIRSYNRITDKLQTLIAILYLQLLIQLGILTTLIILILHGKI